MAGLDPRTEGLIESFTREVRGLYGEELLAVILYGSAVGPDYIPAVSDLNILVVLREVGPEHLAKSLRYMKRWRKSKINPLFLDPRYIESALDTFPIEFLEMKEQHRLLWGEDLLQGLEVSREHLRLQCEQELRGKWLNLRQIYLETARNPRQLKRLLTASLRPFGVVMSSLLRLKGFSVPPREFLEVLAQAETAFGLELAAFHEAYQLKLGLRSFGRAELHGLFARYLTEVRQLAQAADRLFKAEGSS